MLVCVDVNISKYTIYIFLHCIGHSIGHSIVHSIGHSELNYKHKLMCLV